MERLAAALEKMHQILTHLSEVLPGAGGIGGMLTAMKMDIDAVAAEIAAFVAARDGAKAAEVTADAAVVPAEAQPKGKKAKAE